ncbi:siderophore-interacting protein [Granulosicoccus antarcticus]|uniref:Vibriobactin utilization protein ViuB n=1 Tax=Granulosicoccus antarcticus IMCC3135 TaxID=1192854 RepID=A0A2Z2NXX9_9GAMM|nr:siderophore-interacting protein [Granulosicoccus antarcticus]ASJ76133.1 Vibriobactin utilization protein ViuB [Granulosicoccus antarcticus IMCC3135]
MAEKRSPKELTVTAVSQLTPNMRRVTLQGEDLARFPDNAEGAYIKLTFDSGNPERPIMRTYTVAQHRAEQFEIDVDFMLHVGSDGTASGIAAPWSLDAKPGDAMPVFGPGPATFINTDADWFLLAADMTALPALVANLALLPESAGGYIVVEILADEDKQDLQVPVNMDVIWVVNPHAGSDESPLFHALEKLEWFDGQVAAWAACEFKTMKKIRQFLRVDKQIEKSHLYISSYWKQGLKEEEHKVAKKEDAA